MIYGGRKETIEIDDLISTIKERRRTNNHIKNIINTDKISHSKNFNQKLTRNTLQRLTSAANLTNCLNNFGGTFLHPDYKIDSGTSMLEHLKTKGASSSVEKYFPSNGKIKYNLINNKQPDCLPFKGEKEAKKKKFCIGYMTKNKSNLLRMNNIDLIKNSKKLYIYSPIKTIKTHLLSDSYFSSELKKNINKKKSNNFQYNGFITKNNNYLKTKAITRCNSNIFKKPRCKNSLSLNTSLSVSLFGPKPSGKNLLRIDNFMF